MQTFLQQVAEHIHANYAGNPGEICIVMPNRRAGLFLKKYLAESLEKPTWSPAIFSVEDFFVRLSGMKLIDPVGLLFVFYEVHRNIEKENAQPFGEFIKWAQMLLADFNEIDAHLVDARQLFGYLTEAKAIEKWNPDHAHLTEGEKKYLRFYQSLFEYYSVLHEKLIASGEAYQGMIYRKLADESENLSEKIIWKKVIFAGFNALTKAEQKVADALKKTGKAEMLWDADEYYLNDINQEAGLFLREISRKSDKQDFSWIGNYFKDVSKEIRISGVPKNVGQARVAGEILNSWTGEKDGIEKTAVVLADENLLLPVLNSLPDSISDFNVTMGYPLKQTSLFQLINLVFRLFENVERFDHLSQNSQKGFYFTDLLKILQHPYLSYFADTSPIVRKIKESNKVFYPAITIRKLFIEENIDETGIFSMLFTGLKPDVPTMFGLIDDLILAFRDKFIQLKNEKHDAAVYQIEIEYLYQFAKINTRLRNLAGRFQTVDNIKTLRELFAGITATARIPFYGEPLKGLQVMGVLETRNLDFDKIILLSTNEGTLPSGKISNSFIPFDIQKEFGLPTVNEKNAVFAYHFYRLIQRAKTVEIVYNTEADELGGGERSRFVHQLLHEMPAYQPKTTFEERIVSLPAPEGGITVPITIPKDDHVFLKLRQKAESGFSPTSLNRYRSCSLQFYFIEIAGIDEPEEVEETMDFRTIGIIIHEVLEKLYRPFIGIILQENDIDGMRKNLEMVTSAAFNKNYPDGEISTGRNRLIFEVINRFLVSYLSFEKAFIHELAAKSQDLVIRDLACKTGFDYKIEIPDDIKIKLKGTIDRVDEVGGVTRIIDYKTGLVDENKDLNIASWDDFMSGAKSGKAFQVLMYAWLYKMQNKIENPDFETGVISLRSLSKGMLSFGVKPEPRGPKDSKVDADKLQYFENSLASLFAEIFDREIPFTQTDDLKICKNCYFKAICSR